jgi:hypothetical protein
VYLSCPRRRCLLWTHQQLVCSVHLLQLLLLVLAARQQHCLLLLDCWLCWRLGWGLCGWLQQLLQQPPTLYQHSCINLGAVCLLQL